MASTKHVSLKISEKMFKEVETYKEEKGFLSVQEAIRDLIAKGLESDQITRIDVGLIEHRVKKLEDEVDKLKKFMSKYLERAVEIVNSNNKKTKLEF